MSLSLKVDLEGYPKGQMIGIEGIGRLENGGDAIEITPSMEESYYHRNSRGIVSIKEQEGYTLSGTPSFEVPVSEADTDTDTDAGTEKVEVATAPTVVTNERLGIDVTPTTQGDDN